MMKKSKFLNGLSAKLALAVVAVATATFTSCSNESIEIDVTPINAEFVITPVVVANNADVTMSATITPALNSRGQYVITGNPTISSQTVTVEAQYNGMSGTATVNVPNLQAGSFQAETVKIFLSYKQNDLVDEQVASSVETTEIENPTVIGDPFINDGPNAITKTLRYTDIKGSKVLESDYTGNDEAILAAINKYNFDYSEKTATYEFTVPAYSMITPEVKTVKTVSTYTISTVTRASGLVVATFVVEDYTTTVSGETINIGHDNNHGHGNGNAGGGINDAD